MIAKARWDGEVEFRAGYMPRPAKEGRIGSMTLGCRCSIGVLEWREMERTQALGRFFVCPGCEGISVKGPVDNATEAVQPLSAARDIEMNERSNESTTRTELNGTQHGAVRTEDSNSEYEPDALNDNESSSITSEVSHE